MGFCGVCVHGRVVEEGSRNRVGEDAGAGDSIAVSTGGGGGGGEGGVDEGESEGECEESD